MGARRTFGSRCLPEPLRSPLQIPKAEEKRAGQVGARGDSPEKGTGRAARRRVSQLRRGAPWSRPPRASTTPEPLSGLALRPPGPAAPPARPALSVHAQGSPRCPERAPPAGDSTCCRAQPGLDPQAVPGGAPRNQPERPTSPPVSQPASQRPVSPASLAPQLYSQSTAPAALKGPVCSLPANPGGG